MTKSLSNLIKFYNFNVTEDDKKLIDVNARVGNFIPGILSHGEVEIKNYEGEDLVEQELDENALEQGIQQEELLDLDETIAAARKQAESIIEEANSKAEEIMEQARIESEFEKNKMLEEGKKQGYQEGLIKANEEIAEQKKLLEEKAIQLETKYSQLVDELEPQFVDLLIQLVRKMTGIYAESSKDVVLYLMEQSIRKLGKPAIIKVRVSNEDFEYIGKKEQEIRLIVGDACDFSLEVDSALEKNQCIIDTENQIVDCSVDVQLDNLINDLKLLV